MFKKNKNKKAVHKFFSRTRNMLHVLVIRGYAVWGMDGCYVMHGCSLKVYWGPLVGHSILYSWQTMTTSFWKAFYWTEICVMQVESKISLISSFDVALNKGLSTLINKCKCIIICLYYKTECCTFPFLAVNTFLMWGY